MYSSDLFLYSLQVETEIFSTNIDSSYFSSSTGIKRRMATQQRLRLYTNTCSVFFLQLHFLLSTERSHQWDQVSLRKYAPRDTNLVIKKKKKKTIYCLVYSGVRDDLMFCSFISFDQETKFFPSWFLGWQCYQAIAQNHQHGSYSRTDRTQKLSV